MAAYVHNVKEWSRAQKAFRSAFLSLLQKQPFEEIKAIQVINASGYSRSAFYSSFRDLYDLAEQIFLNEIMVFENIIYNSMAENGDQLLNNEVFPPFRDWFAHVYENRTMYSYIIHNRVPGWSTTAFATRSADYSVEYYHVTYSNLDDRNNVSNWFTSFLATKQHLAIIEYWELSGFKYSSDYMAEQATLIEHKGNATHISVKPSR